MINYGSTLKKELRSLGLPVYYELFLTQDTEIPCISYMLADDMSVAVGDTLAYSNVSFYIKVWSSSVEDLSLYAGKIDDKMRELGFRRNGATELWLDGIGQIQLRYTGLAQEYFDEGDNE